MNIDRLRPTVLRVTLHAYEMAALVAAARWAVEGAEGELDAGVRGQLEDVLDGYEEALSTSSGGSGS